MDLFPAERAQTVFCARAGIGGVRGFCWVVPRCRAGFKSYLRAPPRPLLPARPYLLHPWSRASKRHSHIPVHRGRGTFLSPQVKSPKKGLLSLAGQKPPGSLYSSPHQGCATRNATVDGVTQTVLAQASPMGLRCSASAKG